jgi:Trp operon repressor
MLLTTFLTPDSLTNFFWRIRIVHSIRQGSHISHSIPCDKDFLVLVID